MSCEAGVIQQRIEAQAGVVQDGLKTVGKLQTLNNDKYVRVQNQTGNIRPQSSQLAEWSNILPKFSHARKKPQYTEKEDISAA